ncbi:MAG: hypothetical protein R3F11_24630 [Verrucomicrobiales bacterium]
MNSLPIPILDLLPVWLAVLVLAYLAVEGYNLVFGGALVAGALFRFAKSRIKGTRYLSIPEPMQVPFFSGAIQVGSELIVGENHHWGDGIEIQRYAVPPGVAPFPIGTILRVESIRSGRVEVRMA